MSGGRAGWSRLLFTAVGIGLAVALLLGAGGVLPAAHQRADVAAGRYTEGQGTAAAGIDSRTSVSLWRGLPVTVFEFDVHGDPGTRPPLGLDAVPGPGTTSVSPALARALSGPRADELAPRIPGRVTEEIAPKGLVGPDELYAIAASDLSDLAGVDGIARGARFAQAAPTAAVLADDETAVAARLGAACLLVPLLVLVGVSARLSAATREQRNAAIRLVGGTRRQMLGLAAAEARSPPGSARASAWGSSSCCDPSPPGWPPSSTVSGPPISPPGSAGPCWSCSARRCLPRWWGWPDSGAC
ncbi:hypothetical protein [Blastococcus brunescens]|uniref:FtsX-like permease family protein n=1 Tax=Blastococcus brunescens TaxID=1564165 RepID=A0ABZ1B7Z0_9ACTN|nr:hypothetical protein [Blastococcus sp. BMG 8361]WRL65928.1 hypothetical protein U6N30_10455 [Blastococcus sp. BMG 8361]